MIEERIKGSSFSLKLGRFSAEGCFLQKDYALWNRITHTQKQKRNPIVEPYTAEYSVLMGGGI